MIALSDLVKRTARSTHYSYSKPLPGEVSLFCAALQNIAPC